MNEYPHTRTPWKRAKIESFLLIAEDVVVAQVSTNRPAVENYANADFIAQACNCHDDLVEAARCALGKLDALIRCGVTESGIAEEMLRAAIAGVESKGVAG